MVIYESGRIEAFFCGKGTFHWEMKLRFELAEKAFLAEKFGLAVKPTDKEYDYEEEIDTSKRYISGYFKIH